MNITITCFKVKGLVWAAILENDFLALDQQETGSGQAAAWEVLEAPRLELELQCPFCDADLTVNYYSDQVKDNQLICPACDQVGLIEGREVGEIFERQLRQSLELLDEADQAAVDRLGRFIALAAILLEPLHLVFVVGFWSDRIGHFLLNSQVLWLRSRLFAKNDTPLLIAFPPHPDKESNHYVTALWARSGRYLITPAALPAYDLLSRRLAGHYLDSPAINLPTMFWGFQYRAEFGPGETPFEVVPYNRKPRQARHLIDLREYYWTFGADLELMRAEPPFTFTSQEDQAAAEWLDSHDLPADYVTFLGRDQAYVQQKAPGYSPEQYAFRNMDIDKCIPAMNWLADQGLGILRMGSVVAHKLSLNRPGVADYANLDRSEFLDVYLASHCRYSISSSSGLTSLPFFYKKPVAIINLAYESPLFWSHYNADPTAHVAFKNIRRQGQERFLSMREVLSLKADQWFAAQRYAAEGLIMVENTAEEILAATKEMHARYVTGTWVESPEEREMMDRYRRLLKEFYPGFKVRHQLVYSFFKANPHLLADV